METSVLSIHRSSVTGNSGPPGKPKTPPPSPLSQSRSRSRSSAALENQENIPPPLPILHPNSATTPKINKEASLPEKNIRSDPLIYAHDDDDSSVKVVVRIRPVNRREREGVRIVRKLSSDTLSVDDQTSSYKFDSVLGPDSSQEDVFNLVGIPLVKNSLAGFNTCVLSYGQTGSGKTYTMWGPPSAMLDCHSINSYQGLVPRIFQMLFSEIHRKQKTFVEGQMNYQCRCSFLEVYNEQINDLLDPTQRNLQIREDSRNGCLVENLTDEYVTTIEDVTQLLVKGLSNRKVGATSVNSKSSRSHIVFTCILESWCKVSSSSFSSSKTSRISLVDLAGLDRDKVDGIGKQFIKEGQHVKQSLSKLGNVINLLAAVAQSGNDQKIPYSDSCLTHLLKDTLGGNAKVTIICAISPNDRHKAGTLSTLRFGERAKLVRTKALINEITEDDVNGLSDQIRQLKEELIREKSCMASSASNFAYFKGKTGRESLNLLRVSLNRSLILPHIDDDSDELVVDEEDISELCSQLINSHSSVEEDSENTKSTSPSKLSINAKLDEHVDPCVDGFELEEPNDRLSLDNSRSEEVHILDTEIPSCGTNVHNESCLISRDVSVSGKVQLQDSPRRSKLSIVPCVQSLSLQDPTLCLSPKMLKESVVTPTGTDNISNSSEKMSPKKCDGIRSSLQASKVSPTESLAASLHRGLQIIDYHQRNSPAKRSPLGLSFDHLASLSYPSVDKVDVRSQTSPKDGLKAASILCSACKKIVLVNGDTPVNGNLDMQIAEVNDATTILLPKEDPSQDDSKILANAVKRKIILESRCTEQVDQHQHEQGQSSTMEICQAATSFNANEREALLEEIQDLKNQLKSNTDSLASASPLDMVRNGSSNHDNSNIERERERWTESESRWISLTEELRQDLESIRRLADKKEIELSLEKTCTAELDDALQRSILGHARIIEHYVELQETHDDLLGRHRKVMEGIAQVKQAAAKAGSKGTGKAFTAALAAELSTQRIERERERARLKEQNKGLRIQLRDTAEAVHAAGELLVRLKEAEEAVSVSEEKYGQAQKENQNLRKQLEKMKKKHEMEMTTMKHYLAESRLPDSALEPLFRHEIAEEEIREPSLADDQSWRAAFGPSYQ